MADNYLEKKMEEHRLGAAARPLARRLTPTGQRRGAVSMKIDELRVFVALDADEVAREVVSRLCEAGCKVAFRSDDAKAGRLFAQKTGSRCYPAAFRGSVADDIIANWGGLDVIVVSDLSEAEGIGAKRIILVNDAPKLTQLDGATVNAIATQGLAPADVSNLTLILCLSAAACLSGVTLGNLNL